VVPGEYREVTYDHLVILAANVPSRGSGERVEVIGSYEGITAADATASDATPVV
jgi:hypothetical protein